jgi:light-regulated signal transduction histidine kinase (bacteriophytochrome)
MRKLAQEVLGELQHEEEGRDIEIDVQDLAPCQGDRALLKEVLLNLLENALKFTRPRKTAQIRVGCTETEGQTVYFVQDNGVGFAMAASEALFVAFHRVHKSSDFEGTGIGLALARRIIDRHGGRIWAEGEVNKGANFRFTLAGQAAGEDGAAAKASRT